MSEFRYTRELAIIASGVALSLGTDACGSNRRYATRHTSNPACKTINGTTGVRIIGFSKEGGQNAVNSGECVGVYNPNTLRSVGQIAHNAAIVIECLEGPKPAAFRIKGPDGVNGDIDLDRHLIHELDTPAINGVPIPEEPPLQNCK